MLRPLLPLLSNTSHAVLQHTSRNTVFRYFVGLENVAEYRSKFRVKMKIKTEVQGYS